MKINFIQKILRKQLTFVKICDIIQKINILR